MGIIKRTITMPNKSSQIFFLGVTSRKKKDTEKTAIFSSDENRRFSTFSDIDQLKVIMEGIK